MRVLVIFILFEKNDLIKIKDDLLVSVDYLTMRVQILLQINYFMKKKITKVKYVFQENEIVPLIG